MLHRQVCGFGALEYFINISRPLPELLSRVEAIGNQSTSLRIKCEWIDRGDAMACRQRDDKVAIRESNNVRRDDQAATRFGCERRKGTFDFRASMHGEANQFFV